MLVVRNVKLRKFAGDREADVDHCAALGFGQESKVKEEENIRGVCVRYENLH